MTLESEYPFEIYCAKGDWEQQPLSFATLIDYDRTYFSLQNKTIGSCAVSRCDNMNEKEFESRFNCFKNTEKFSINKIGVISSMENKGIMTIIFCEIMLTLFKREMAYLNDIEIKLVNTSEKIINGKIINVYHKVLPNYTFTDKQPQYENIHLEDLQKDYRPDFSFFKEIYYLFPLKTRKDDIKYYEDLRKEKLDNFIN